MAGHQGHQGPIVEGPVAYIERVLTDRVLNRTLLQRQFLLERVDLPVLDMVEHLLGLQAQSPLPPYLSLWSRLAGFDPLELSAHLAQRRAVRVLLMRGTIHLVSAADALELRPLVQPMLDKVTRNGQASKEAAAVPRAELAAAGREVLEAGPLTFTALGEQLAHRFPTCPASHLANTVREMLPLVQVPPRGLWKQSGGVVYQSAQTWLGAELSEDPDIKEVVRRYLRAFGPATAADVTAWSRLTGMRPVLESMKDELVIHRGEHNERLVDLEGLTVADPDVPAPVRLLGDYDNLWLSHAGRSRVTDPGKRARWLGLNGGTGRTIFVDGYLEGLWRVVDGRVETELFRRLGRSERADLDAERARVESLLER